MKTQNTPGAPERIWALHDESAGWSCCHEGGPWVEGEHEYVRVDTAKRDISILLAQIDFLEGCFAEGLEGEDAAIVARIRAEWAVTGAPATAEAEVEE